jgi:type I restriction enzyme, S subunit
VSTAKPWPRVPISKVANIASGNSIPAADRRGRFSSANVVGRPFISTKDVSLDGRVEMNTEVAIPETHSASFRLAPAGSTLVCAEGGSAGRKVGWLPEAAHFGNKLFAVSASSGLDARFLFYFHQTDDFAGQFAGHLAGLIGGVSLNKFKTIELPVPPLEEQKRIVAVLDKAFAALDRARAFADGNISDAECLWERLQALFARGHFVTSQSNYDQTADAFLDEIGRQRQKKTRAKNYDIDEGFEPPFSLRDGWKWVPLGNLCDAISDGVHKTPSYVSDGIPFVTVKNLTASDGICFADTKFITKDDHLEFIKRTHPERDDILITKDGTIGVVRRIETDTVFSIFVSVALIKPTLRKLSEYLTEILSAPDIQRAIVPKGSALKHLYLADLRRLPVPIGPKSEMQESVARLKQLKQLAASLRKHTIGKIDQFSLLRSSLLQKAFAGELT